MKIQMSLKFCNLLLFGLKDLYLDQCVQYKAENSNVSEGCELLPGALLFYVPVFKA